MDAGSVKAPLRITQWWVVAAGLVTVLAAARAAAPPPAEGAEAGAAQRRGLTTEFVETLIEGVPVGSRYVLASRPVSVRNTGDYEMDLRFDATVPEPVEMRAGYEPIPDAAWVSFEPRTFSVPQGGVATGKLVLYIPDDPALVGRRFEVMLYLHGAPKESPSMAVGLSPRVFFSIRGKGAGGGEPKVDTSPRYPKMTPLEAGSSPPVLLVECSPFTVENIYVDGEEAYEVSSDPAALRKVPLRRDEVAIPDPAWVTFSPPAVVLGSMTKATIGVTARIPLAAEHLGRTYAAGVHTVATYQGKKTDLYNKVRITMPPVELTRTGAGAAR